MTNLDEYLNQICRANRALEQKIRQITKGKETEYQLDEFIKYIRDYTSANKKPTYTPEHRRVPKLNKSQYRENKNALEATLLTYLFSEKERQFKYETVSETTRHLVGHKKTSLDEKKTYTINSLKEIPGLSVIAQTTHSLSKYIRAIAQEQGWIRYNPKNEEYTIDKKKAENRARKLDIYTLRTKNK